MIKRDNREQLSIRRGVIMAIIHTKDVTIGYEKKTIIKNLSIAIPTGKITSLIGPNGSGKSTLLKAMARVLKPQAGAVYLNEEAIHEMKTKAVAQKLALLAQSSEPIAGLTVEELVAYGRFPYQSALKRNVKEDQRLIQWAMEATGVASLKNQQIDALSGGQQQRVWIAMALAQDTDVLILDEPITYLDPAHQLEILTLLEDINQKEHKTILMTIHDLNHASRFSDFLYCMKDGDIVVSGTPQEVFTKEHMKTLFEIEAEILYLPKHDKPIVASYDLIKGGS